MTDQPTTIRVLVADVDDEVRREIRSILGDARDIEVVGEAASRDELNRLLCSASADVLVVDLALQQTEILQACAKPPADGRQTKIVVMSQRNDSRYVTRAIHAGATGYLLKDHAFEELVKALHQAASGRVFISAGIAGVENEATPP